ncbi:hypothetical protein H5410_005011 [Solanum commersonii]|uniref:Uncharacterized protein n=1 Tax=Solanum commersonii TaxID=4109 RepID=A0A9J6A5H5_SOLCO|nr:hypothetical protein H5410_005011 [Solanum commersonii]
MYSTDKLSDATYDLAWYCNMYPIGKLSVAIVDLSVGYAIIINLLTKVTYEVMPSEIGMKFDPIAALSTM